tara:strand:- start:11770 stop:12297 length:528 start_codon:yes stop_codon:yes gene_type:complete
MKNLILYMSHHGTTAKVVHMLSGLLGHEQTKTVNLHDTKPISLEEFDTIIIGGSIHAGKIQRKLQHFCEDNIDELLHKHVGLFICHIDDEQASEELNHAYPTPLLEHASARGLFGGELLVSKMNFIEKMITKKINGVTEDVSNLHYEAITKFADTIKSVEKEPVEVEDYSIDMAH